MIRNTKILCSPFNVNEPRQEYFPLIFFSPHISEPLANATQNYVPVDMQINSRRFNVFVTYMLRPAACPLKKKTLTLSASTTEFCSRNTLLILISTIIHKCQRKNKLIFVSPLFPETDSLPGQ